MTDDFIYVYSDKYDKRIVLHGRRSIVHVHDRKEGEKLIKDLQKEMDNKWPKEQNHD